MSGSGPTGEQHTPHLHERFPELRQTLPFLRLGAAPSPVSKLPDEMRAAGELWLKDDGAYGEGGWGGNKVRKLEWLIPDAQRKGAETIFTVGALATNWGLATARYGREHGLKVALALVDQPLDDHVRAQLQRLQESGAALHFTHNKPRTAAMIPLLLAKHTSGLTPPYYLPAGGSSPVGTIGYVEASLELAKQIEAGELPEPERVVCAVGSGGTLAGLTLGLKLAGLKSRPVGIVVNDALKLDPVTLLKLARKTEQILRDRGARLPDLDLTTADFDAPTDWLGAGYGHATTEGEAALESARELAGLRLEPVYTAKALAGALAQECSGPVLFINTNGPR